MVLILWITPIFEIVDAQSKLFIFSVNTELLTDVIKCMNITIECWVFFQAISSLPFFFFVLFLLVVVENNFSVKKVSNMMSRLASLHLFSLYYMSWGEECKFSFKFLTPSRKELLGFKRKMLTYVGVWKVSYFLMVLQLQCEEMKLLYMDFKSPY